MSEIKPLGAGVNLLPHAMRVMDHLGVAPKLCEVSVETKEAAFFNRFGQLIYSEAAGRVAGFDHPQLSIHRGDLQFALLDAVKERLGLNAVEFGRRVVGFREADDYVDVEVEDSTDGRRESIRADVLVGCDGVHSAVRKQLHPDEGLPLYSGTTMWRGVVPWEPILTGATMVRAGWLSVGKMVIYPIRDSIDASGKQLVNWVAEVERPMPNRRDWNRVGSKEDFLDVFRSWTFDWLDVPAMIEATETVLEYPMADQNPLTHWTSGGVTLLGDAAHPMVPRGSNGAGQAILDAACLAELLAGHHSPREALLEYESIRLPFTSRVVETNRQVPPDAILREVHERSGDRPFERIEDIIQREEMLEIADNYRRVAGYSKDDVNR